VRRSRYEACHPRPAEWTSANHERMLAAGMFEKIELLAGDVVITGAAVRSYRWTLEDYEQLIALGLLEGKHVELIQGEILSMASMGELHALTIMQLNYAFCHALTQAQASMASHQAIHTHDSGKYTR
jgi:hypothetical protein